MKLSPSKLSIKSQEIRRTILEMVARSQASHIGSAFSCLDILISLYFNVANIDPENPSRKDRDRIILSKGHAGAALLAVLAHRQFFPIETLKGYYTNGSLLEGHPMIESSPGIEMTSGSLGHGLPLGLGMALALRSDKLKAKVFVILSDGELDEGSTWEAILAAGNFGADNLVAIVDYNKLQGFGTTKEVMDLEPLAEKWESFKWVVREIDGHNFEELNKVLASTPFAAKKPSVVIANTVKGKGVSFMENKVEWHYKSPNDLERRKALSELS